MKDTSVAPQLSTSGGANIHRFKSFRQRIDATEINVARRIERDLDEPDKHVIHALVECPTDQLAGFRDGIALLFFECMRSVKSQLHSRASGMLVALLRELYKEEFSGTRLESNDVYVLVAEVLKLCLHHADREASEQLWLVLFDQFDAQARAISKAEAVHIQPFAAA
ncbi:hypothetical protein H4R27_005463 [Coemansia aciculifera]|nr:hypothetical protein H4R27_005463 [Coemansia aciculifera]